MQILSFLQQHVELGLRDAMLEAPHVPGIQNTHTHVISRSEAPPEEVPSVSRQCESDQASG